MGVSGVFDLPPIDMRWIWVVVALLLAARFRRQMLADRQRWTDVRTPVSPSLRESPSPFARMWDGVGGCAFSIVGALWFVFCVAAAIDFALARGVHVLEFIAVLVGR